MKRIEEEFNEKSLKCDFCQSQLSRNEYGSYGVSVSKEKVSSFRCLSCPKLVTYFFTDCDYTVMSARTIWTKVQDKDVVVFKNCVAKTCTIQIYHPFDEKLNTVTDIPYTSNINPINIDNKVPIYITFS